MIHVIYIPHSSIINAQPLTPPVQNAALHPPTPSPPHHQLEMPPLFLLALLTSARIVEDEFDDVVKDGGGVVDGVEMAQILGRNKNIDREDMALAATEDKKGRKGYGVPIHFPRMRMRQIPMRVY